MFKLFKPNAPQNIVAMCLYEEVVKQARQSIFYSELKVPDTPDGRYDMIMIHAFLLLYRLKKDHRATATISQTVFDLLFEDMDKNLREMGFGDVGVSNRVKDMAKAFYGRIAAYEDGLSCAGDQLETAIKRNVYRNTSVAQEKIAKLCDYIRGEADNLAAQSTKELLDGKLVFRNPKY